MITCAECGKSQYEGAMFCNECGSSLLEIPVQPTDVLPFSRSSSHAASPPLNDYKLMTASVPELITFVIPGRRRPLTIELVDRIRIGRSDMGADVAPELDLTEYDGMEKGVSRVHAVLQMSDQGIILSDLDSTNGTVLNGNPLPSKGCFLLHSGDEVRLGDLVIHIFFEM
jgi:hypothetical protein